MIKKGFLSSYILVVSLIFCQKLNRKIVEAFPINNHAFHTMLSLRSISFSNMNTSLFMGAFNKRNKQADLQKKMALAKKQKQEKESGGSSRENIDEKSNLKLTAAEIKEINDRKRFEDLLNSESATHMSELGGGTYLTTQQEEEEIDAACKFIW